MSAIAQCRACGHEFQVDDAYAGKLVRCTSCKEPVRVGAARKASSSGTQRRTSPSSGSAARGSRQRVTSSSGPNPLLVVLGVAAGVVVAGLAGAFIYRMIPELSGSGTASSVAATSEPEASSTPDSSANASTDVSSGSGSAGETSVAAVDSANTTDSSGGTTIKPFFESEAGTDSSASGRSDVANTSMTTSSSSTASPGSEAGVPPAGLSGLGRAEMSWADLNEHVGGSIVKVEANFTNGSGIGSGFVIDPAGLVVTNYHVLEEAKDAVLLFENRDRIPIDGVVHLDAKRDIAIVTFDPSKASTTLRALPLAMSIPRKGEEVAAFGSPQGLEFAMTQSIVNAVRNADELSEFVDPRHYAGTWLQHSTPISPGNSGGPLINRFGEVVGMNTFTITIGQALNFAIAATDIQNAMAQRRSVAMNISPSNIPIAPQRRDRGQSGDAVNPYDRPDLVDATGDERGRRLMAKMKSISIAMLAFSHDPQQTAIGAVRSAAREGIERAGLKSSLGGGSLLVIAMKLERQGIKNTLWITAFIIETDKSGGREEVVKVWEQSDEVGTVSEFSLANGTLPSALRTEIKKFFSKLRLDFTAARKEFAEGSTAAEPAKP